MIIDDPCYCPSDIAHAAFSARSSIAAAVHVDRNLLASLRHRTIFSARLSLLFNASSSFTAVSTVVAVLRRIVLLRAPIECVLTLFAKLTKIMPPVQFVISSSWFFSPQVDRRPQSRRLHCVTTTELDAFHLRALKLVPITAQTQMTAAAICTHAAAAVELRVQPTMRSKIHRTRGLLPEIHSVARFGPPATKILNCEAELKCVTTLTTTPRRIPREIVIDAKFT